MAIVAIRQGSIRREIVGTRRIWMEDRAPSMLDVAKVAGVSHQTVSRVLNDRENVAPRTRQKVLSAMSELGYRPNHAAKALVTGKTSTIGLLGYNTTLYGPSSVMHAVQDSARDSGYSVNTVSLKSADHASVVSGIQDLYGSGVDGIVIIAPQEGDDALRPHIPAYLPAVLIEGEPASALPSVNVDQIAGTILVVNHLISLGHRRIAHISGQLDTFEARQRLNAWRAQMLKSGLEADLVAIGDWTLQSGYDAVKELMSTGMPTAIFAANDGMAIGALKALSDLGISVPSQMSLVGFDDVPEAAFLIPGLTTVSQDFEELGRQCIKLLVSLINHEPQSEVQVAIKPELIVRGSTARSIQ